MALPGVNTIINDRFYTLSRTEAPIGTRVAIIGRRNDPAEDDSITRIANPGDGTPAPDGKTYEGYIHDLEPYNASGERGVIERFGTGSDLHRGYLEATSGGATRVTLIGLPADTSYDYVTGLVESATWAAATDYTGTEDEDAGNGLFHAAFAEAEAISADIIVPWGGGADYYDYAPQDATPSFNEHYGFYANNSADPGSSFAVKVANKCAEITKNSHPCMAILGVRPWTGDSQRDGAMQASVVNEHLALPDLVDKEAVDNGMYLTVVATELIPLGYNKYGNFGFANGAATFAGSIAQLDSWSAPTNKLLFNVEKIRYNPTKVRQQDLVNLGVVPVGLNFNRAAIWVDGHTFAKEGSDYSRLTTVRIIFDAVQSIRQAAQKFIGEATTLENRNSLDTAISSRLRSMQQLGALLSSDFTITYVPAENKAIVDLVLQPAFELRRIEIQVSVQL